MNHNKKKIKKGRYNFLIDESVYQEFSHLCDELGLIRSKNLENHMKEFISKTRENKNKE
jgi:hypothetical protein